jgi:clathrin heavy chain
MPGDFPVVMHISSKFGLLYVVTKFSFLYVYEITTASLIHRARISQDTVFIGAKNTKTDGLYVVTKQGALILNSLDESQYV